MSSRSEAEGKIQSSRAGSSQGQSVQVRCSQNLVSSVHIPQEIGYLAGELTRIANRCNREGLQLFDTSDEGSKEERCI